MTSSANYYHLYESVKKHLVAKVSIQFGKYSQDISKALEKEAEWTMAKPTLLQAAELAAPSFTDPKIEVEKLRWEVNVDKYK